MERERYMEFDDKKECIVFEDVELFPALPYKKRTGAVAKTVILCACLLAVVIAVCAIGGWMVRNNTLETGGSGEGGYQAPLQTEGSSVEDDVFENASGSDESEGENGSNAEEISSSVGQEDTFEDIRTEPLGVDLSFSEKGDGYFYNYAGHEPDVEGLLDMGFRGGKSYYSEQPVVLILHTYIREGYYDLDPDIPTHAISKSVISVGERIAYELNQRGIPTVHSTVIHGEGSNGAYADAAETIRSMLEIYPTIKYVIDLRRLDERDGEGRALSTVSALGTAQIRLTVSSRGASSQDALALSLELRRRMNKDGQALCMPVVYTDVVLNAGIVPYYIRVDVGASGNVTSEALDAGEYFAEAFANILKKQ